MRNIKVRVWDGKKIWGPIDFKEHLIQPGGCFPEPIILMQFTGLQDTNGRDIYEGDILEIEYGLSDYYYVVEWVFAGFQLVTYKKPGSTIRGISDGLNQGYFEESDETKVIGNIYETAETAV